MDLHVFPILIPSSHLPPHPISLGLIVFLISVFNIQGNTKYLKLSALFFVIVGSDVGELCGT